METIETIAKDFVSNLVKDDLKWLKTFSETKPTLEDFQIRNSMLRYIRNRYRLWDPKCPLTETWHRGEREISIFGCDKSINHPDNISHNIFDLAIELVKNQ